MDKIFVLFFLALAAIEISGLKCFKSVDKTGQAKEEECATGENVCSLQNRGYTESKCTTADLESKDWRDGGYMCLDRDRENIVCLCKTDNCNDRAAGTWCNGCLKGEKCTPSADGKECNK